MAIFDFIKKKEPPKPEVNVSQLPELKDPDVTLYDNSQTEQEARTIPVFNAEGKEKKELPQPTPIDTRQEVADATRQSMENQRIHPVVERLNNGEDVFQALLRKNYEEDKASLERQRKAEILGNIANLFGQTVTSAAGGRIFQPIRSKVPEYNQALDRIRQGYNSMTANYSLRQAEADRQKAQMQFEFDKDRYLANLNMAFEAGLIDQKHKNDMERQAAKAKNAEDLAKLKYKHDMAVEQTRQNSQTEREKLKQEGAMARATGKDSDKISIVVATDENGGRAAVDIPKSKQGAIISLYKRMQQLSENDKGKHGSKLESINLQFGEGGDVASKALTIIQRRLQDFPELTDEFLKIVGKDRKDLVNKYQTADGWSLFK